MYNFDKAVNQLARGSSKWQQRIAEKPDVCKDVFPFSAADVDFYPFLNQLNRCNIWINSNAKKS